MSQVVEQEYSRLGDLIPQSKQILDWERKKAQVLSLNSEMLAYKIRTWARESIKKKFS